MPVKVRCDSCEHVVNAPDRARGKAVRCPECGNAVRVPAETAVKKSGTVAKKQVAAPPPSSSMVIANLDLDKLEDTGTRICPKCSAEVSEEDIECPECHINLDTGQLSNRRQAELGRKGPDPRLYYKEFISDGITFWKKNKVLSISLAIRCTLFTTLSVFCLIVAVWCVKPLAQDFWFLCSVYALLIPPGLAFGLHTTIIEATMRKKKKLGKYHFDNFLGAALGLKLIFWFVWIALPLHVLAVVFLGIYVARSMFPALLVAAGLEGAAVVFASLLFPLAMTHFSMPVTIRGWLVHKMSRPFFRTMPAIIYWCGFLGLVMFAPVACVATAGVVSGKDFLQIAIDSKTNAENFALKAEVDNLPKTAVLNPRQLEAQKTKEIEIKWNRLMLPSGLLIGAAAIFGATAVLMMRTNGQYARYFMNSLDLETMAPEATYVAKAANLGELEGEDKKLTWKPVITMLALGSVMGVAMGGSFGMTVLRGFAEGAPWGMVVVGGVEAIVGASWLVALATKNKKLKGEVKTRYAMVVLINGLIYGGSGAAGLMDFGPGKFDPPSKYVAVRVGILPFECQMPEGWNSITGGGTGGVPMSVRINNGGSISIDIRESEGSSEKGKMKKAIKEGKEVVQIGGGGANLHKLGDAPAVESTHSYHLEFVTKNFSNYKEGPARSIETGFGEGKISDFTAQEGWLQRAVKGCRASIVHRSYQLNIVCKCHPSQFEDVRPVFEKIISSLAPREGPGGN